MSATATASISPARVPPAGEVFTLSNVSWELYELLLRDVDGQNVRITYDNGDLALMSPLPIHEVIKKMAGSMVEQAAIELDLPCRRFGSTTWKRRDLGKGIEADECYYFQHAEQLGNRTDVHLDRDPAPDLAIEVDITHHPMDRASIYAKLGVAELWRYDGERFAFLRRTSDGRYEPIDRSLAVPVLTPDVVNGYLARLAAVGERRMLREFRDWLRTLPEAK